MSKINHIKKQIINKLIIKNTNVIGIVKKYNDKFGFLRSKDKVSYFIPEKYINLVMHRDKVLAKIFNKKNKVFAKPIKLIKSFLNIFIGNIKTIGVNFFIQPNYPFLKELILCNFNDQIFPIVKSGDWFFAKLLNHKLNNHTEFQAQLVKFIARDQDTLLPWKVVLAYYNVDYKFPKTVYDISFDKNIPRKDLTNLKFITIDDKSTKDIDDAVFLEKYNNQNIKIIIAISDPTAFINPDSELDQLAANRLFTNYLPGFIIPMLPKKLSEDIFSLHPNKKKPVLACEVIINQHGNISKNVKFFLAWIRSYAKLNYNDVSNLIQGVSSWNSNLICVTDQLNLLHILCYRRILWRKRYALISQNNPEYKFHFSDNKDIVNISMEYKSIAHKMVEEAMIIANISAAKFLSKNLGFGIYSTHTGFNVMNAKHVSEFMKKNNINIDDNKVVGLIGFCRLYRTLNNLKNCYINNRIRRYQSLGTLSLTPKPHCSLGLEEYLTWTSPIRKYSDMINHRLIKNVILGNPSIQPSHATLLQIINCKRRHKIIKKNIENWLYIRFFQKNNQINKIFEAKIFNILPSGIKARLLVNGANIFIPNTYIHHIKKELICDQKSGILYLKNKEIYRVTNTIMVIIVKLKIEERVIIAKPLITIS